MSDRRFIRPPGHEKCSTSTGIHDCLTFGRGKLDGSGFWSKPCEECARAHEQQFPEDGPCWPHTEEDLRAMGFLREGESREDREGCAEKSGSAEAAVN